MFRCYRDATKCYVYLLNVSRPRSDAANNSNEAWELMFRKSEWFTRGWTLQELIAPAEREPLGNKAPLERHICEMTGIPVYALRGKPLSDFSITERMPWAASRETYRPEDKAYSLLGIFDVNMPLIYVFGDHWLPSCIQRQDATGRMDTELTPYLRHPFFHFPATAESNKAELTAANGDACWAGHTDEYHPTPRI